jgi:hypothetical protein
MQSAVADVIRIGGIELRFLVDETQGSGDLVIFEMTVQPNARVPSRTITARSTRSSTACREH